MKNPFVGMMFTLLAGGGLGQGIMFLVNEKGRTDIFFGSAELVVTLILYFFVAFEYWLPLFREYRARKGATQRGTVL